MDAIWDGRLDGSRDAAGKLGLGIGPREGIMSGANVGCPIVTNGEFVV